MPISSPVPHEIRAAFESGVTSFLGELEISQLARVVGRSIGLQVFALRLDRLDGGIDAAAVPAGWLFLTGSAPDHVVASEVYDPGRGMEPTVVSVSRESANAKVRRMVERLDGLAETRAVNYEVRVLRIPPLSVEAFWLKSPDAQHPDLVVPCLSLLREIRTGVSYPAAEFLAAIQPFVSRPQLPPHNGN